MVPPMSSERCSDVHVYPTLQHASARRVHDGYLKRLSERVGNLVVLFVSPEIAATYLFPRAIGVNGVVPRAGILELGVDSRAYLNSLVR